MRRLIIIILFLLVALNAKAWEYPVGVTVDTSDPSTEGLEYWYPFVAGSGSEVLNYVNTDANSSLPTAIDYNGTTSGWVYEEQGCVMALDGVHDYVSVPISGGKFYTGGKIFTKSYTLAMWYKPADGRPVSFKGIFAATNAGATEHFFIVNMNTGTIRVDYKVGNVNKIGETDNPVFANGQETWHHIVVVHKIPEGQILIYLDGEEQVLDGANDGDTSALVHANLNIPNTARIGAYGIGYYNNCRVDDFRLYSKTLTDWEVKQLYADSLQRFPVSHMPVHLLQDMSKDVSQVDDWTTLADGSVSESTEIDISANLSAALHIDLADIATNGAHTLDAVGIIVQVSSASSGDEDWSDYRKFYLPPNPIINETREFAALNNVEAPAATVLEMSNTTGYFDDDGTRWAFIQDDTLVDSEMVYVVSHVGNTSLTILDGTANAHTDNGGNAWDGLYDIAKTFTLTIPVQYSRARIIFDNTYEEGGSAQVVVKARASEQDDEEVTSAGQVIIIH